MCKRDWYRQKLWTPYKNLLAHLIWPSNSSTSKSSSLSVNLWVPDLFALPQMLCAKKTLCVCAQTLIKLTPGAIKIRSCKYFVRFPLGLKFQKKFTNSQEYKRQFSERSSTLLKFSFLTIFDCLLSTQKHFLQHCLCCSLTDYGKLSQEREKLLKISQKSWKFYVKVESEESRSMDDKWMGLSIT